MRTSIECRDTDVADRIDATLPPSAQDAVSPFLSFVLVAGALLSVLSSLFPARQATRISPVQATTA